MTDDPLSLDRLAPVVELEPVGWFPFAPGIWFLIALIGWWSGLGLLCWIAKYRKNAYRREACRLLKSLEVHTSFQEGLRQTNEVLKRTALVAFPRHQVASLWGAEWIQFLQTKTKSLPISGKIAECLASVTVQPLPDSFDREDYLATIRVAQAWVQKHQREPH